MLTQDKSHHNSLDTAYAVRALKMKENNNKSDTLTTAIGAFGKWHTTLFIILIIPTKMSSLWTQMAIIFLAPKTDFRCVERSNVPGDIMLNSTCYSDCVRYEYSSEFDNTIISEWGLVCGRKWLANFTQTMCMFGILIGSVVFGYLSDRFGRRTALLSACMIQLITSFIAPFSPNFWTFTTIRFFLGTATAGIMIVPFTLMLEVTGPEKRELASGVIQLPLTIAQMVLPLFAYFLRSWNTFTLGLAVPNLLFLMYFFLVPESPKWLISMGQLDEASRIMTNVAKRNNLPTLDMANVARQIAMETSSEDPKAKATYMDLIRRRSVRVKNICSCVSWFILGLSFYGSNQYIGQTSSNVYVTVVMAGGLQIPGIFISLYCCRRFGRRVTLISFFIICGISNGLLAVPDDWFYWRLVFGTLGVSAASGAFSAMYMFTIELFPTVIRNMALGASSMTSRVGSMIAPFVAGLGSAGVWGPPTVFAIAPLVAAAACFCLPETRGVKMSDALDD